LWRVQPQNEGLTLEYSLSYGVATTQTEIEMAETKHTPGPWTAEMGAGKGAWVKGSTGEWSALACGDTDESANANAALIAAAPDLLSACRAALAAFDGSNIRIAAEYVGAVGELRDAIAKAEGRS
jgi:hypothetical protein